MNWALVFMLAVPAMVAALIVWMIAAGYSKTDGMPPEKMEPNPYPERLDTFGRWFLGIFTAVSYVILSVGLGVWQATVIFAFVLLVDVVGALIWTVVQELSSRSDVRFPTRLLRNIRDFYIELVGRIFLIA